MHIEITKALLQKLEGVKYVSYKKNPTFNSIQGYPPISVTWFIDGGDDDEIARVIHMNNQIGICVNGDFEQSIYSFDGYNTVSWVRLGMTDIAQEEKYQERCELHSKREQLIKELEQINDKLYGEIK